MLTYLAGQALCGESFVRSPGDIHGGVTFQGDIVWGHFLRRLLLDSHDDSILWGGIHWILSGQIICGNCQTLMNWGIFLRRLRGEMCW